MKLRTADIVNPKRGTDEIREQEGRLFPYYAGYSAVFTKRLLTSLDLNEESVVLDPWNGAGTTTRIASSLNLRSIGCDLNPVMVLIAKANLISPLEAPSLQPLAAEIAKHSRESSVHSDSSDPLSDWLAPSSALAIRSLERQINKTLISSGQYTSIVDLDSFDSISPLAALMYLALFRTARRLLSSFSGSNPTWVKKPAARANRLRPTALHILHAFASEVALLGSQITKRSTAAAADAGEPRLFRANSSQLPIASKSIDWILTSPPYCTRIDYAVATAIELAVLGVDQAEFDRLRRSLLGTSTVEATVGHTQTSALGITCNKFLERVANHPSRASSSYYYKNHLQYFDGLQKSISETSRVLRNGGGCICIVQDSYYKDVHNDLPKILGEMAEISGLNLTRREDFSSSNSMVSVNSRSRKYLNRRQTVESVLCFELPKNGNSSFH